LLSTPYRCIVPLPFLGLRIAKQKLDLKLPHVSEQDAVRLVKMVNQAAKVFQGNFEELESAIGMLFLGHLVGWRVLVLIHNKRTIKKYERILGIAIRKEFKETGPFTAKSVGYDIARGLNAFWKAVSGEQPIERRRELQKG
jgi:hypothetical protein